MIDVIFYGFVVVLWTLSGGSAIYLLLLKEIDWGVREFDWEANAFPVGLGVVFGPFSVSLALLFFLAFGIGAIVRWLFEKKE